MSISIQHNPFATRFTRPGEIPFVLRDGKTLDSIAEDFFQHQCLGQIVGPHGCGKTTVTFALEPILRRQFSTVRRLTIRSVKRVLAEQVANSDESESPNRLLIVDGLERLPWLHRRLFLKQICFPEMGLLVTTHRPLAGVPHLYEVRPTIEMLRQLTDQLAPGLAIDDLVLSSAFNQSCGNIRESLMKLYDWYESRNHD